MTIKIQCQVDHDCPGNCFPKRLHKSTGYIEVSNLDVLIRAEETSQFDFFEGETTSNPIKMQKNFPA